MGPIDYTLQVQQPLQSALQGYQLGTGIRNDQQQQAAQQLQLQQQQAALAQQEALRQAYAETASNPTAENYARLMTLDPKASEGLQRAWSVKNTAQQQSTASELLEVGAAIKSGQPQVAAQRLSARADAIEQASGGQPTRESQVLRTQAKLITDHPEFALGQVQAMLAANPLGKDAAETLAKFGTEQRAGELFPDQKREGTAKADKAVADAKTAGVTAKFAEPQAIKDLEAAGWKIENIKSEIGYRKEQSRIAAMSAALAQKKDAREARELEIKIQEAQNKLGESARAKVADVESATASIDNLVNTVDRLKKNPGLKDVLGSVEGSEWYPTQLAAASTVVSPYGLFASSGDDRADAVALIETLKSQAFLAMAPSLKGMGALSNAEGEKLQAGLQNLSRKQSEKQFNSNLDEVQRLVLKARKTVETRYGIKAPPPDTPAVESTPAEVDALVSKYLNPRPPGAR